MRKDVFLYVGQRRQTCLRIRTFVYGFLAIYIPETKDSSETEHMLRGKMGLHLAHMLENPFSLGL